MLRKQLSFTIFFFILCFNCFSQSDLPFDLRKLKWLHTNISDWPVTKKLREVRVSATHITLDFEDPTSWPAYTTDGGVIMGNPWIILKYQGTWYAATWEWLRHGQTTKFRYAVNGDHIKKPPLNNWSPVPGETYYFMAAGLSRFNERNVRERTSIVAIEWPSSGESASSRDQVGGGSDGGSSDGGTTGGGGDDGGGTDGGSDGGGSIPDFHYLHNSIEDWDVTSKLKVSVSGSMINLRHSKIRKWPKVDFGDGSYINANAWIGFERDGQWYAVTWAYMRPGVPTRFVHQLSGKSFKIEGFYDWRPVSGETYYFAVSGLARNPQLVNVEERSNWVKFVWP